MRFVPASAGRERFLPRVGKEPYSHDVNAVFFTGRPYINPIKQLYYNIVTKNTQRIFSKFLCMRIKNALNPAYRLVKCIFYECVLAGCYTPRKSEIMLGRQDQLSNLSIAF